MTTITVVGSGNMAAAIGTRAAQHGHVVEVMSRNTRRARELVEQIGEAAPLGTFGARPAGDLVIIAVLHQGAVEAVRLFGDALEGKILLDITNPFNATGDGLVTSPGHSISQQIAAVAPPGTSVVKAFNTIFRGVLEGRTVDALYAGDADAKTRVAEFLQSLGLRPRDVGGLEMTHVLEWAGVLLVGSARHGEGFDIALTVRTL